MDEAPLHGPVPLPVAARDLRELPLLPNALLVLGAFAPAPGLLARQRPRMFPVSAVRAPHLRRGFDVGLPAGPRAASLALADRCGRQEIHRCSPDGWSRRGTGAFAPHSTRVGQNSARPKVRARRWVTRPLSRPAVRAPFVQSASGHSSCARGESIDRTRARRDGRPTSAWASSPCRKVRARRPVPARAPSPPLAPPPPPPRDEGRHGIPLSTGRDPSHGASMSRAELTSPPRPDTFTTQSQRRRGCAP